MKLTKKKFIDGINKYLKDNVKHKLSFNGIKLISFVKEHNGFDFQFNQNTYLVRFRANTNETPNKFYILVWDYEREKKVSLLAYTINDSNFIIENDDFKLIQNRGITVGRKRQGGDTEYKELMYRSGFDRNNIITSGDLKKPNFNKILNDILVWLQISITIKLELELKYGIIVKKIKKEQKTSSIGFISNDEKEQNELENIFKFSKSRIDIKKELQNVTEIDDEEIIINQKKYKRDNKTIALLKIFRYFKCQICGLSIPKKNGDKYVEAAHIKPKHVKGRETPDNIILLCPNHHKEFDLGEPQIIKQDMKQIEFVLNEKRYKIKLSL
jgi:hypothetical protein